MRLARVPDTPHVEVIELDGQVVEELPGRVGRHVVDCMDLVEEAGDVAKRLLDMEILVAAKPIPTTCMRLSAPRSSSRGAA